MVMFEGQMTSVSHYLRKIVLNAMNVKHTVYIVDLILILTTSN